MVNIKCLLFELCTNEVTAVKNKQVNTIDIFSMAGHHPNVYECRYAKQDFSQPFSYTLPLSLQAILDFFD